MTKDNWLSLHYWKIRYEFEHMLNDSGRYEGKNLREIDDGREEFVEEMWQNVKKDFNS